MPGKSSVNLIPKEEVKKRNWDKYFNWVLTYGRYVIIGTEIIVLTAFLLRFKLDRDLKTLSDDVANKKTLIESFGDLENQTRTLQAYLATIKSLENQSLPSTKIINSLSMLTPTDVTFSQLRISPTDVNLSATALSLGGFATFINGLKLSGNFSSVSLDKVRESPLGIEFTVRLVWKGAK